MHVETLESALDSFISEGLISEVLHMVKSGKEAAVYCCRAGTAIDADVLAAKVYKPRSFRSFRNDAMYREGRVILNRRDARAFAKRTEHGREVGSTLWTSHEWEVLSALFHAGADVPAPIAHSSGALLLEFVGDSAPFVGWHCTDQRHDQQLLCVNDPEHRLRIHVDLPPALSPVCLLSIPY